VNLIRVLKATVKGPGAAPSTRLINGLRRPRTSDVSGQPPRFSPKNGRLPQGGTAAYQAHSRDAFLLVRRGRPAHGRRNSDRGCPMGTTHARRVWHACGTTRMVRDPLTHLTASTVQGWRCEGRQPAVPRSLNTCRCPYALRSRRQGLRAWRVPGAPNGVRGPRRSLRLQRPVRVRVDRGGPLMPVCQRYVGGAPGGDELAHSADGNSTSSRVGWGRPRWPSASLASLLGSSGIHMRYPAE
jgi:hypothetical protein